MLFLDIERVHILLCLHCWEAWTWFWTNTIILIWNEKIFKALLTQHHKGKGSDFPRFENVHLFPFHCHLWERVERTSNANDHQGTLFVKISIMHTSEVSMSWCDSFCQLKRVIYPCSEAEINGKACWVSIIEAFLASKIAESSPIVEPLKKSPVKKNSTKYLATETFLFSSINSLTLKSSKGRNRRYTWVKKCFSFFFF